jgi:hypothetical protein
MPVTNTLNWTVMRNDTWSRVFTIRDESNAVPVGLATSTITLTIRDQYDAQVLQVSKGDLADSLTVDGTTGEIAASITFADTEGIPVGQYAYDIEIQSASGVRLTPVIGTLTVRNDVTRS